MSAVPLQLVEYGKSAKKPWPDPIAVNDPDHYKFNKWSQNGLTEYDFSKNKITGPTVIFGVFDEYHFASFDCLTWASSNPETQKIKSGGEIDFDKAEAQLKANMKPQYRDYVLNRWLDENGNEYPRDKKLTKDVKLHPDWIVRAEVRTTTQTGPGEVRQFKSLHEAVDYANNIGQTITIETQQYAVTEVKVVLLDSFVTGDQNHPNDHPNGQAYVLSRDMTFDVNDHKLVENSTNAESALTVASGKKVKIASILISGLHGMMTGRNVRYLCICTAEVFSQDPQLNQISLMVLTWQRKLVS